MGTRNLTVKDGAETDYLGDPMPLGYEGWECDVCTARCNYEAMTQCARRSDPLSECGFEQDQPESNFGHFAFIRPKTSKEAL